MDLLIYSFSHFIRFRLKCIKSNFQSIYENLFKKTVRFSANIFKEVSNGQRPVDCAKPKPGHVLDHPPTRRAFSVKHIICMDVNYTRCMVAVEILRTSVKIKRNTTTETHTTIRRRQLRHDDRVANNIFSIHVLCFKSDDGEQRESFTVLLVHSVGRITMYYVRLLLLLQQQHTATSINPEHPENKSGATLKANTRHNTVD